MIIYTSSAQVRVGDVLLFGSSSDSNIVFGSPVARVSEYDETIYVEDTDGYSVPFGPNETVTVIR